MQIKAPPGPEWAIRLVRNICPSALFFFENEDEVRIGTEGKFAGDYWESVFIFARGTTQGRLPGAKLIKEKGLSP